MSPVTNIFSANTKAKSSEVNTNFTDLAGKVVYMNLLSDGAAPANHTSYADIASGVSGKFYFIKTANITEIKLYVNLYSSNGSGTASAQIYNDTDTAAVSGSEVTTTSTDIDNWEVSGDIKANIPATEKKFVLQNKISNSSYTVSLRNAFLKITYK